VCLHAILQKIAEHAVKILNVIKLLKNVVCVRLTFMQIQMENVKSVLQMLLIAIMMLPKKKILLVLTKIV
jgi:hypothetical protein